MIPNFLPIFNFIDDTQDHINESAEPAITKKMVI